MCPTTHKLPTWFASGPQNLHTDTFNKASDVSAIIGYFTFIFGISIIPIIAYCFPFVAVYFPEFIIFFSLSPNNVEFKFSSSSSAPSVIETINEFCVSFIIILFIVCLCMFTYT